MYSLTPEMNVSKGNVFPFIYNMLIPEFWVLHSLSDRSGYNVSKMASQQGDTQRGWGSVEDRLCPLVLVGGGASRTLSWGLLSKAPGAGSL